MGQFTMSNSLYKYIRTKTSNFDVRTIRLVAVFIELIFNRSLPDYSLNNEIVNLLNFENKFNKMCNSSNIVL